MEELKFGCIYEPSTEAEVVLLFGLLMPHMSEFFRRVGLWLKHFHG